MNNDTVMYIAVAAAVLAVIALIMICQVRSSLNQSAAPAAAPKKRHRQQLQEPLIMVLL